MTRELQRTAAHEHRHRVAARQRLRRRRGAGRIGVTAVTAAAERCEQRARLAHERLAQPAGGSHDEELHHLSFWRESARELSPRAGGGRGESGGGSHIVEPGSSAVPLAAQLAAPFVHAAHLSVCSRAPRGGGRGADTPRVRLRGRRVLVEEHSSVVSRVHGYRACSTRRAMALPQQLRQLRQLPPQPPLQRLPQQQRGPAAGEPSAGKRRHIGQLGATAGSICPATQAAASTSVARPHQRVRAAAGGSRSRPRALHARAAALLSAERLGWLWCVYRCSRQHRRVSRAAARRLALLAPSPPCARPRVHFLAARA